MHVAVVVHHSDTGPGLCRWGYRLARALETELAVLWCPETHAEDLLFRAGEDFSGCPAGAAEVVADLMKYTDQVTAQATAGAAESEGEAKPLPPPLPRPQISVICPAGGDRLQAVLEALDQQMPELLVLGAPRLKGRHSLARRLFGAVPCQTLLLRSGSSEAERCRGILVASAGGPSARSALRLGHKLAFAEGVDLEALFVHSDVDSGEEVGHAMLARSLAAAGVADKPNIVPRVVLGDDLSLAIENQVADRLDLVLLGASHIGVVRSLLFGTVPERLLADREGVAVGVVREPWSPGDRLRARLGRWLDLRIPQLEREQRVELYRRLESGSAWSFDFMLLMALSTSIAALGLIQSSAAVVIGAMLVAPLMTPILGLGLALLQGNVPLLRAASRALVSGYGLALALGFLCGLVAGPEAPTSELLARGGPTPLDMGVAFLSGLAAAYCLGRPGLLAALPGVAIAAALVPPIATTGIAVALGESDLAEGSSILFGTNVVAIILGAVTSLFAVGVRARAQPKPAQRRARLLIAALLVLLAVLAIPLTHRWNEIRGRAAATLENEQPTEPALHGSLRAEAEAAGVRLMSFTCRPVPHECQVTVAADQPLEAAAAKDLARRLREHLDDRPKVRLITELNTVAE